jgi:hypothetical protein
VEGNFFSGFRTLFQANSQQQQPFDIENKKFKPKKNPTVSVVPPLQELLNRKSAIFIFQLSTVFFSSQFFF